MIRNIRWYFLGACLAVTGCIDARYIKLPIKTEPAGAAVTIDGTEYISPAVVVVRRRRGGLVVTISKEGYKTEQILLVSKANVPFGGENLQFPDHMYRYEPEEIRVQLEEAKPRNELKKPKLKLNNSDLMLLSVSTHLTTKTWLPFSEEVMLSAVKDKAVEELSQSKHFRLLAVGHSDASKPIANLRIELILLEKIDLAKVKASLDLPDSNSYVITESESLAGKNYNEIFRSLERLGTVVAGKLLKLVTE